VVRWSVLHGRRNLELAVFEDPFRQSLLLKGRDNLSVEIIRRDRPWSRRVPAKRVGQVAARGIDR
jgi:hypothetical protein